MGRIQIDLHNYHVIEALREFIQTYNDYVKTGCSEEIEVIHGYGSIVGQGVIRKRIRLLLEKNNDKLDFKIGEHIGNPGVTIVYPKNRVFLCSFDGELKSDILDYCKVPKTKEKIFGEFRKLGEPTVMKALKMLESERKLKLVYKGNYKCYQRI